MEQFSRFRSRSSFITLLCGLEICADRLASAPRYPVFAGHRSPQIVSVPETGKLDFFGAKDFYEPVLTRHGAELLQQGVEHYIQVKDKAQLRNAYRWVRQLLTHEVNPNLNPTQDMPVLNRALGANKTALAELLKKHGAQSASQEVLNQAWDSIVSCIQSPEKDTSQEILEIAKTPGFNINHRNRAGATLLFLAVRIRNHKAATGLLKAGANPDLPAPLNAPLLPTAVLLDDLKMVKLLLEAGANPNVCNCYGNSALQIATMYGFRDMQTLLRKHGATEPTQNQ